MQKKDAIIIVEFLTLQYEINELSDDEKKRKCDLFINNDIYSEEYLELAWKGERADAAVSFTDFVMKSINE